MTRVVRVRDRKVTLLDSGHDRERSAPVLLALHGYPDTARIFARLADALGAVRLVAPDWPGQGDSDETPSCFGPTERAAWLRELLDVLAIDRCAVFGHDMGALPALALARDLGDRVRSVVVANALLSNVAPTSLAIRIMRTGRAYRFALPRLGPLVFARCMATFLEGPLEPELEEELRRRFLRRTSLDAVTRACVAYDVELPVMLETLRSVTTPAFALWATRGHHFALDHGLALRRVMPHLAITAIDGAHWMVHERAAAVAEQLSRMLG